MKFRDIIDSPCGIRYMLDTLPLSSGFSLSVMLDREMMITKEEIEHSYTEIKRYETVISKENILSKLRNKLCLIKDISKTIERIACGDIVDDIELFEVKHLVLIASDVRELISQCDIEENALNTEAIDKVLGILDPDGMKIASFYIFDAYSEELAQLRRSIDAQSDIVLKENMMEQERILEAQIRKSLCELIVPYAEELIEALYALVNIDINIAKAEQIKKEGLCFPTFSDGGYIYIGMFHPFIKAVLAGQGKEFTDIDISLAEEPTLLIGANMGGKTVVLKMLVQNQYLCQFGMGIPAKSAAIALKHDIFFISGDAQNIATGLSSFAAEMRNIDAVVRKAQERNCSIMALIDEPARSTNPIEGTALVEALIEVLREIKGCTLALTTHYNISSQGCCRYRVCGLENGKMNYRLRMALDGDIPREALDVAESLNISPAWIGEAKRLLNN